MPQRVEAGLSPQQIQRRLGIGTVDRRSATGCTRSRGDRRRAGSSPVLAAVLAAGDGSVASHFTAGALWGLPNFDRDQLEVSTGPARPATSRRRAHASHAPIPRRRAHDASGHPGDLTRADAGRHVPGASRSPNSAWRPTTASDRRSSSSKCSDVCVAGLRPAPGRHPKKIQAVLADAAAGYDPGESTLQMRFARGLVAHGCPEPVLEHRVRTRGRRSIGSISRTPTVMLAIEVDSWEWHHSANRVRRRSGPGERSRRRWLDGAPVHLER